LGEAAPRAQLKADIAPSRAIKILQTILFSHVSQFTRISGAFALFQNFRVNWSVRLSHRFIDNKSEDALK
jgi:hypothetical protein